MAWGHGTNARLAAAGAALLAASSVALAASTFGLDRRVRNDVVVIRAIDELAGQRWSTERVFPALSFRAPTFLTNAGDGSKRIFVCERRGVVWALEPVAHPAHETPSRKLFLDLSGRVKSDGGDEEGLLSIAFHPKYAHNGQLYVCYSHGRNYYPTGYQGTRTDPVVTRVSRFEPKATDPGVPDPASEKVLLEVTKPYFNHNGGQLAFGPDGYLYASFGDGGSEGDPEGNGQRLTTLKSKIVRIDVDKGDPYTVPSDNPFVGKAGVRPEIWAIGLRNPWRFSFDKVTGRLYCGDVGQDQWESIDEIVKGGNYGWSIFEGGHRYQTGTVADLRKPIAVHSHTTEGGGCIIGGYVYHGSRLPELEGVYVYGDYVTGNVWGLRHDGTKVTEDVKLVPSTSLSLSSFGLDEEGELYLVSYDESAGTIHRLVPVATGGPTFPRTISATGIFADVKTQKLRPELMQYDVNEPLWSDGALKARAFAVPGLATIDYKKVDAFGMPNLAIAVKSFYLELTKGRPDTKKIVETRLLIKNSGKWYGYSYEWNDQGTDATLLGDLKRKKFTIDDGGQSREQEWYFPSRGDCARCHASAAGFLLGIRSDELNREHDYASQGGHVDNQLRTFSHIDLFSQPLPTAPARLPKLVSHDDASATLEARARSWLHVNCSMCHRPGGSAPVALDLRVETPLDQTNTVGKTPEAGDLGIAGAEIVKKGDPDASVLYRRLARRGADQMPPLATSVVDEDGASVIAAWIRSLR